ncbi:MAG: Asp-tRNA(Asn)/Glu-tRNA(Gln) amidotransferase subunit GatB [Blastocatellia bacterium]
MKEGWEAVIGLEVHSQLNTSSKLFSSAPASFGDEPNANTDPIVLGLPGALPVVNRLAIRQAGKAALALGLRVNNVSIFSRKHYFYPDLPKGYQISQYDQPFSEHGVVEILTSERDAGGHPIEWQTRRFGITRAHLEEDAGKSIHEGHEGTGDAHKSNIDLNRAGTPLLEIVSEPDFRTSWEAYDYMAFLRKTLQYVGVCDGNMEEGNLRCDANVSVRRTGAPQFGTKVEVKNLNSLRFLQKAIDYEIARQIAELESGGKIYQETRLWNERENRTYVMRTKEDAHDYRYFPEPDLPPLEISDALIATLRAELPELPEARRLRFMRDYAMSADEAGTLTAERALADYYETAARVSQNPRAAANWILSELLRELKNSDAGIGATKVTAENLAALIRLIDDQTISGKIAKEVFADMIATGAAPGDIIKDKGLSQITDTSAIEKIVEEIIAASPKQAGQYRAGRTNLMGYFVGQTLKASGGKANPQMVNEIVKQKLG